MANKKPNKLLQEASPYLQQHAYNPVEWYGWGKEAFLKAKKENKPILLSIGYAACHWCHVMAHESFEDESTAKLMNQHFVNIKVDKEERPDLDKIYQTAHYFLSHQGGGWPLTIFLTPDLIPFFSGTYFPPQDFPYLPSFKKILKAVSNLYQSRSQDINQQSSELKKLLEQSNQQQVDKQQLTQSPIEGALTFFQQNYDYKYGGFGDAPKFPQASKLKFLINFDSTMALNTLQSLEQGGIYDQLGGGFFRYAVDERWNIPHFEKMLYDNGQLLELYALAFKKWKKPSFKATMENTAEWLMQCMQSPEGGYYSSLDADSEGEEGKFYRWDRKEVKSLLEKDEYLVISSFFGLNHPANFERYWHFYQTTSLDHLAQMLGFTKQKISKLLAQSKEKLLYARANRIYPFRDEKILTSWNSLAIKGMLLVGETLGREKYSLSAQKALQFIKQTLWNNSHLLASYKDGKVYLEAYLDDYAFLLDALLTALQVAWSIENLNFARQLVEFVLANFVDNQIGGFFFTVERQKDLLYRPKTMMDEATPSGNGIFVHVLLILGYLLAETRYINIAQKALENAWKDTLRYPAEHCSFLLDLNAFIEPPIILILRGEGKGVNQWQQYARQLNHICFFIPATAENLPLPLAAKKVKGKCCAYLCQGFHCEEPITDFEVFKQRLK